MAKDDETLGRRKLLERTGAALGLLTVAGCEDVPITGATSPMDPAGPARDTSNASDTSDASDTGGSPEAPGDRPADSSSETDSGPIAGNGPAPSDDDAPDDDGSDADADAPADSDGDDGMDDAGDPQETDPVPPENDDAEPTPSTDGIPVAFVQRDDLDEAVARAVELAGGLDAIEAGQTVFIKPNAVSLRAVGTPGIRTSNEVLAAVVRLVKQRNPGRIIVGDRSARGFDSAQVFDATGMGDAAMAAGADEIYPAPAAGSGEDDHWMMMQPPNYAEVWGSAGGILVMRKIVEADHLINVPACKNHRFGLFTLSMKNFVGGVGDSSRDPLHYASSIGQDFEPLGRDIALLNQPFSPLMNIIDATTTLINGGPQGDGADAVPVATGIIMASKDRVALDTAGVALIKHELGRNDVPMADSSNRQLQSEGVWSFPQIVNAIELGLGVASAAEATLIFDGVDMADATAIETIWKA